MEAGNKILLKPQNDLEYASNIITMSKDNFYALDIKFIFSKFYFLQHSNLIQMVEIIYIPPIRTYFKHSLFHLQTAEICNGDVSSDKCEDFVDPTRKTSCTCAK